MADLKTFEYSGINRAVPQSMAPDGSCQEIINARERKGCWRPIGEKLHYLIDGNIVDIPQEIDEVYLHDIENGRIPGEPNWIGYDNATGNVYLLDPTDTDKIISEYTPITTIADKSNVSIVFLKRTMIICSGDGVQVFLYNGDKSPYYFQTAALPVPDVDITFGTSETVTTEEEILDDVKIIANSVLGKYYETLNVQSQQHSRFYGSFCYMVAYRMFDGSYIMHSIPRYFQISNDGAIKFTNHNGTINYSSQIIFTLKSLKATINNELYPESISESKALIDSVCVFATKITPLHQVDDKTITESFIGRMFNLSALRNDPSSLTKDFKDVFPVNSEFSKLVESGSWYLIQEFNFEDVVGKTGKTTKDVEIDGYYQDYATRTTLTPDQFTHHNLAARSALIYNDRLHLLNIKTNFGKPYVQWEDNSESSGIGDTTAGTISVWIKTALGEVIITEPISVPSFIETQLWTGTVFDNVEQAYLELQVAVNDINYLPGSGHINFSTNGVDGTYTAEWKTIVDASVGNVTLPSIVGYNDARAFKIQIVVDGKLVLSESLLKNKLMNFAYWHNTSFSPDPTNANANYKPASKDISLLTFPIGPVTAKDSIFDTNRLQVSEIQNPLIFPAKYSYQIGTGDGLTMAAGSEPLSTGQFGQFPLQVFTTKGIWALEIGLGDVLYTNVLPVSAEVIENRKNVISVGSGVVYSTHNGLFVLNGRQSTQLSEIVEGKPAIAHLIEEIDTLIDPGEQNIHFTKGLSETLSTVDFLAYLQNSSIGFDYDNHELIVTNANYHFSYIYSFESQKWFKFSKSFTKLINSYPKLLGVTSDSILSLSQESDSQEVQVMFITNAQSFESPDRYKKLERFIQRIKFGTEYSKVTGIYIFASDDLVTWQLMVGRQREGSYIKDLVVQRTPGSARHFVFVLNGTMKPDSEIKQIETFVKIKWNNRLR